MLYWSLHALGDENGAAEAKDALEKAKRKRELGLEGIASS